VILNPDLGAYPYTSSSINESKNKDNPLKFADSALEIAVDMLLKKGC